MKPYVRAMAVFGDQKMRVPIHPAIRELIVDSSSGRDDREGDGRNATVDDMPHALRLLAERPFLFFLGETDV